MTTRDNLSNPLPKMTQVAYEPKIGETITLTLPDERTRAEIVKVVTDETCLAKLLLYTTSKSHNYKKDDLVPCRYDTVNLHQKGWRIVSQRELDEAQAAHEAKKKGKKDAA